MTEGVPSTFLSRDWPRAWADPVKPKPDPILLRPGRRQCVGSLAASRASTAALFVLALDSRRQLEALPACSPVCRATGRDMGHSEDGLQDQHLT